MLLERKDRQLQRFDVDRSADLPDRTQEVGGRIRLAPTAYLFAGVYFGSGLKRSATRTYLVTVNVPYMPWA